MIISALVEYATGAATGVQVAIQDKYAIMFYINTHLTHRPTLIRSGSCRLVLEISTSYNESFHF